MSKNKQRKWFRIDNAGKLYPSITSTRVSTVYRISATLTEEVNPQFLQEALERVMPRFPYFHVNLRRGFFWYYFIQSHQRPVVEEEKYDPCLFMHFKNRKKLPYRVLYYKKKISLEMTHSMTDGTGALIFFKTLLVEYFRLHGLHVEQDDTFFDIHSPVEEEEYEDAFYKYYDPSIPYIEKRPNAMHFPFDYYPKGVYSIVTGIVDSNELYKLAKHTYNCTVTQLLMAVYFMAIQDYLYSLPEKKRKKLSKPICLNMPVNLRGMYPTKTLRNFFVTLMPRIDPRLGEYTFEEVLTYVMYYMKMHINKRYISQFMSYSVRKEKAWGIRLVPLSLKDLAMPFIYYQYGEKSFTSSLSNVGIVKLPKAIEPFIERMEVYPPPSTGSMIKATVLTVKNKSYISFGSLAVSRDIEKNFFTRLRKMGLHVKVESNH